MNSKKLGFTIVELLIVIVVIGILSGIIILTYQGVTSQSRNSQTAASIKVYVEALNLHKTLKGSYPTGNADNKTCLGTGYPDGKCWNGEIEENESFTQALKSVHGDKMPASGNEKLGLRGAWFSAAGSGGGVSTLNGTPENFVVYSVEGASTKCPVGPIASDAGDSNILTYSSTPPASGQTYAANALGAGEPAQCWIPLSLIR